MSSSYITGSGSSAYVGLGGLFRARLQQSDNPVLKSLAAQLGRQDKRAKILQDVISPQGFVGVDGKMKYIPGISFSNESALFDALQVRAEISEESLKQQIDAFAKKRQDAKFDRLLEENRQKTLTEFYETQRKERSARQKARADAMSAYLAKAFGINKQKTEYSAYTDTNRPEDYQIFGPYTGNSTDYINEYTEHSGLTAHFASAISYDFDSNVTTKQSVKIANYQYKDPANTPSAYVVRLTGSSQYDPSQSAGSKLAAPEGYMTYKRDADGEIQTVAGSGIVTLSQAELGTLEYVMDFTDREEADAKGAQLRRQDFLSVMAVAPDAGNPAQMQRGYISKISLNRGDFSATPSSSGDQVYHAKMSVPKEQFFNSVTLKAEGVYISDGSSSSANAGDGTLLDMINEGRVDVFAREMGYDTRLFVDADKSVGNTLVLSKDATQLIADGVELFITVKAADRDNISFSALNMGTGKA